MAAAVPGDELSNLESKRLLDPIDRISEILFGLLMAVTIVGSLSIATAGRDEVRTVLVGALGCNLAWGLVDAVMYLVRQLTEKTRRHVLVRQLQSADSATAHRIIAHALPAGVAPLVGPAEIEAMHARLLALPVGRPRLDGQDFLAAFGVFLLVVVATFPVVLPFLLVSDLPTAMKLSRYITVAMLYAAGHGLGRYAGHPRPFVTGALMALLGVALILAIMALGG
jgi:VIT1/CCC1 family predicted Fe2+/Mn2+ transporter